MRTNEKADDSNSFFEYASMGLSNKLEQVLSKNPNLINIRHNAGKNLLHYAVENGQVDCVKILIQFGAQVNAVDLYGKTPLHGMMERCTLPEIAAILVEHGADINRLDGNGNSPLTLCAGTIHRRLFAWGNYQNLADLLLEFGAHLDIHCASMLDQQEAICRILETDPHQINSQQKGGCLPEGKTPLHHACERGHFETVKELLGRGANPIMTDSRGSTAFYLAVHESGTRKLSSDHRIIELLLSSTPQPLDIAYTLMGAVEELKQVIGSDQSLLDKRDEGGNTHLHLAAWNGKRRVVEYLISQGADPNAQNKRGEKPIDLAVTYQNYAIAEFLLAHGAEVNIFTAVRMANPSVIEESLIKQQVN